jgi:UDP-galactopyranose mutase
MDIDLLDESAALRPDWNWIVLGPVVKIDPETLPRRPNIHYLGAKSYQELPAYLSRWDVAILPFAKNPSTRFISPTKTPEYLAAGKPVVSTSIRDVVYPYKKEGLVAIADTADGFVREIEGLLSRPDAERSAWLEKADQFLSGHSWDKTWSEMTQLMHEALFSAPTEENAQAGVASPGTSL